MQKLGIALSSIGALVMLSNGQLAVITHLQFNQGDILTLLAMCGLAVYAINISPS